MSERLPLIVTPDEAVASLQSWVRHGDKEANLIAIGIRNVLETGAWRQFKDALNFERTNETFEEFVESKPPKGLGIPLKRLQLWVSDDTEARDAIDDEIKRPAHKHADVNNINVRPQGTSKDQALRRLRKDAPALHKRVLAGELTAHAAMIKAGFRHPTMTVRADDVSRALAALIRRYGLDAVKESLND